MDHGGPELTSAGASTGRGPRVAGASFPAVLVGLGLAAAIALPWLLPGARAAPFSATFDSPRALGEEVLRRLGERDAEGLGTLALSEGEFKDAVWPEMPARGDVPVSYVWSDLQQKGRRSLAGSLARYGGRRFELLDVRFTKGTTPYRTFVVHRRARLLVRDEQGREGGLDLFGSVIERDGRFKLFSYVVDR